MHNDQGHLRRHQALPRQRRRRSRRQVNRLVRRFSFDILLKFDRNHSISTHIRGMNAQIAVSLRRRLIDLANPVQ